jgi:hypothetical protein
MGSPSAAPEQSGAPARARPCRRAASRAAVSPVATEYSCRPHIGGSDSLKDERRPVARWSQFQPPSGHCHSTSERARSCTRASSAIPRRQHNGQRVSLLRRTAAQRDRRSFGFRADARLPSASRAPVRRPRGRVRPRAGRRARRAIRDASALPATSCTDGRSCPRRGAFATTGPASISSVSGSGLLAEEIAARQERDRGLRGREQPLDGVFNAAAHAVSMARTPKADRPGSAPRSRRRCSEQGRAVLEPGARGPRCRHRGTPVHPERRGRRRRSW